MNKTINSQKHSKKKKKTLEKNLPKTPEKNLPNIDYVH